MGADGQPMIFVDAEIITGWWFQIFFIFIIFHPYLGKIPILTNIFQMGWNHQPDHQDQYIYNFQTFQGHKDSVCDIAVAWRCWCFGDLPNKKTSKQPVSNGWMFGDFQSYFSMVKIQNHPSNSQWNLELDVSGDCFWRRMFRDLGIWCENIFPTQGFVGGIFNELRCFCWFKL